MHHGDSLVQGVHGIVDRYRLPVHQDLALIHLVDSEHTLHQGGFASAVFSHQGVHFAWPKLQLHVVQRLNARERLADARHFQYVFRHEGMPPLVLISTVPFAPCPRKGTGQKALFIFLFFLLYSEKVGEPIAGSPTCESFTDLLQRMINS